MIFLPRTVAMLLKAGDQERQRASHSGRYLTAKDVQQHPLGCHLVGFQSIKQVLDLLHPKNRGAGVRAAPQNYTQTLSRRNSTI